ncbi:MAG: F0F1 ATP synthase subunit A, partial [Alphaproteobacteria bacterium]|nr:F0F1 ATP synthase subunit A [Alphaproteobacteria bacterium]
MAAEHSIDPMHQFSISPVGGGALTGHFAQFTNSALWMLIVTGCVVLFMWGGMQRKLIPGRWQVAAESLLEFINSLTVGNIGPEGRKFTPWVFTLFSFILIANLMGLMPFGIVPAFHPFTITSQFSLTGVLAIISFSTVLVVGFWRHGFHFFSLFIPHGTPLPMIPLIFIIELISFMVRPFSLALRLFVAMIAGHILMDVFANFIVNGIQTGSMMGGGIS